MLPKAVYAKPCLSKSMTGKNFVTDVLYNWINHMYEEEIHFGKLLLKQS